MYDPSLAHLDVHDLLQTARGKRALNAILFRGAELYVTARGRYAVHLNKAAFAQLTTSLHFVVSEGLDGLALLGFARKEAQRDVAAPEVPQV